ncbi:hypothetical protein ACMGDM_06065 [Sphingomonas sp. DT-51]|uniref:hypothetical protein n=1 Tax=Sphingomonas sp. DT-51 TaxID=3396165 RepID=UPI003F1C6DE7
MFHVVPAPTAADAAPAPAAALAALSGDLERDFVDAGARLARAVSAVQRVIGEVDGLTHAIDAEAATRATADLRTVARRLTALPATQARRSADLDAVGTELKAIRARVLDLRDTLRLLAIYGPNIKIAASGEPLFVAFVDGMLARLRGGDQQLAEMLGDLSGLAGGVARGTGSSTRLAAECVAVVPEVPDRLDHDAATLDSYLADVRDAADQAGAIARAIQRRVASALGAIQVGDSTRQRIDHVVAMLTLAEDAAGDELGAGEAVAVGAHLRALAAAQTRALTAEFAQGADRLVTALRDLGGETQQLLALIARQERGGGVMLAGLDRDVAAVRALTERLAETDREAAALVGLTTTALAALAERCAGLRLICRDVQDIVVNMRLLCRRFGATGKAVAVVAVEIGGSARRLDELTAEITAAITRVATTGELLAAAQRDEGAVTGDRLALAAATIRHGCAASEQGVHTGGDEARALIAALDQAGAALACSLGIGGTLGTLAEQLAAQGGVAEAPLSDPAERRLCDLLERVGASYTMAAERDVHRDFLRPGMAMVEAEAVDDDGLF